MQVGEPGPPDFSGCGTARPVKGALRASLRDGAEPHPGQRALSRGWLAIGRPRPCGDRAADRVRVYLAGEKAQYPDSSWPAGLRPGSSARNPTNARRHARDYERLIQHSETLITWAAITLMTRRITRAGATWTQQSRLIEPAI